MALLNHQICNCFAIRQAARVVTQLYERHVSQCGITSQQFTILAVIHSKPGAAMSDLAEELVMDRTSVLRALKPLQRDGYVVNQSKGKAALHLSDAGKAKLREASERWRAAQKEWEGRLGSERATALREELIAVTQL